MARRYFVFTIEVGGYGETRDEAWSDAIAGIDESQFDCDDYITFREEWEEEE